MCSPPPPEELPHSTYFENSQQELHDSDAWRRVQPFSAGYRRRPVTFIPAGSTPSTFPRPALGSGASGSEVAQKYLELVGLSRSSTPKTPSTPTPEGPAASPKICETCGLEVGEDLPAHERTLAHQASLPISHPPHSLPRSSIGLKILQQTGWDPDARVGLGPEGEGGRYPLKAVEKLDRRGVGGGRVEKPAEGKGKGREKLNAKMVRRLEGERKKARERLMGEMRGDGREALLTELGGQEGKGLRL